MSSRDKHGMTTAYVAFLYYSVAENPIPRLVSKRKLSGWGFLKKGHGFKSILINI